ncbi:flavodoxin domain-containing protein [Dactylosporangium sp. NPDC049140]|uniref:flavodoxin domain-containing protein n=1 Tax=Dactylosporangium sp. NPDC049140 TaxID=3155647 RepID=UPI0033DBAB6F
MRVLVTYADDDGASEDTARLIGDALVCDGIESVVRPVETATLGDFDAVILGSTARAGHWPRRAIRFALTQRHALRRVPVWLYSNSPAGDAFAPEQRIDITPVEDALTPLDHRPFLPAAPTVGWPPQALQPDQGEVRGWAHQIATALQTAGPIVETPFAPAVS